MSSSRAYTQLCDAYRQIYRFQHLSAMAGWDRSAKMPPKGNEARAAAVAELEAHIHHLRTAPALAPLIRAAREESLDEFQQASLREIERDWRAANALPVSLVEAKSQAGARCEHAWRQQRRDNDWAGFLVNFKPVLALSRQEAQLLASDTGLRPYDALLDRYEPGMRCAELDGLFGDLKAWLPALIARVSEKQAADAPRAALGPFPLERQKALGQAVMGLLGFDFEAGRLDESAHPFSGGVPEDVRLTTRYQENDFVQSLMGVIHETGHARFEQNLPREWLGLPIAQARSFGIHESQSLAFEMQLARSAAFAGLLTPLLQEHLGPQPAFEADNLSRLLTRSAPGLIRVHADEVTYPAHIILRYEIERDLIEGVIEAEDIPALWNEKMQNLLGLSTLGNDRDGCMQDVHWTDGSFGYFPSYTLGAMYAAQWFACIRRQHPDLDQQVAAGHLEPVFDWLQTHVWSQASRWETGELVLRASGEPLNPHYLRQHLERRYLG